MLRQYSKRVLESGFAVRLPIWRNSFLDIYGCGASWQIALVSLVELLLLCWIESGLWHSCPYGSTDEQYPNTAKSQMC
jgi:hypothetical protein